ncbi:MAG: right-handed parallel beta-helix repeat-containing protein, partial [Phycisphaerales bacterium]|nr:right-handed parallel beta-helix repeat-containing protein [Phycisphaerales bacterium]
GREIEMNDRRAIVVGICDVSSPFFTFPVIFTRYSLAMNYVPPQRRQLSFVVGRVTPGADQAEVLKAIDEQTSLRALDNQDFLWMVVGYYLRNTGIPVNFGITILLGFLVGAAIAGQTTLHGCDLSNNGGSGCVADNPLYAEKSAFASNALYGARCVAPDGTTLAASMDGCTIARNGSDGVRVSRGRYANADCQISDNGGTGIVVADGCLLMTNSMVHRSGGDGVSVVGTLTVNGGALRRNAGAGARSSGGPVSLEACAVELNGAGSATVAAGLGGLALSDCATVRVSRCSLSENTGPGMRHLRAQATFSDMTSIDVTECTAGHNAGPGILLDGFVGGSVSSCVLAGNAGGALALGSNSSRCRVGGNTFSSPPGQGDALVRVFGSAHLVVGNSLSGGGAGVPPIVGGQGSTVGQVVSGADVSTRCSPSDNIVH